MLHVITAWCVACDLHRIAPGPLERTFGDSLQRLCLWMQLLVVVVHQNRCRRSSALLLSAMSTEVAVESDLLVENPVAADHTAEVFEVVNRLQLGAISWGGGSVGNCSRCWLKQDLCLAKADGETEEAGGFCKLVDDDLEVRLLPCASWVHSRQQTMLPGQTFSQSLSWLSVGEGWTGSR